MGEILKVDNLVKRYQTANTNAVDGISFEVYEGEFFCLLGVNGAGKSTTINIICTLLCKSAGDVLVDGKTLGLMDEEIRKTIGVVFQGNVLDDVLTARENIESRAAFYGIGKEAAKKRIEHLAQNLSMTSFLDRKYARLSGGQRRKCDIARALLAEPKILFLDEPTTGLDPQSRIELWQTINDIRKKEKMAVFLTTHYMEETEKADRVAIIDGGKVLCIDTPQKLKTKYSSDKLTVVAKVGCESEIEKRLKDYKKRADSYILRMKNGVEAIDILAELKPYIDSFEMEKGNMDNVFLNVVGRSAE